jgi:UDP-N-acetylglucosamine 2-epimerase (non-hydrolysing)
LSDVFLNDLGLPRPHISLDVGSGDHGMQTARVLERFECALKDGQPDLVIVVGDVNSTLACAIAAAKVTYPDGRRPQIAHVEAGLRSFDRTMPEEINRVLTDAISDFLFITEEEALRNLLREGIPPDRVYFVGNVMIDTLRQQSARAVRMSFWRTMGLKSREYALLTIHRPSNVDDVEALTNIVDTMIELSIRLPLVCPLHPRTKKQLEAARLLQRLSRYERIRLTAPLGYIEFLSLMSQARLVLTDSGGVQEETTVLGIPCLTLRQTTERPVTITKGTNKLVGTDRATVLRAVDDVLEEGETHHLIPDLWDGRAAKRICEILETSFSAAILAQAVVREYRV